MKWFVGLMIIWAPTWLGILIAVKAYDLGWAKAPSSGGKDIWPLGLTVLGIAVTFGLNLGRQPGWFLDKWLSKWIKDDEDR